MEKLIRLHLQLPLVATTDVWGAFCPCIGILFAALISSTVDKLWARQERLRSILIRECRELAALTVLLTNAADADWAADQERTKQALVEKQREEAREKQQVQAQLVEAEESWLATTGSNTEVAAVRVLEPSTSGDGELSDGAASAQKSPTKSRGAGGAVGGLAEDGSLPVRPGDPKVSLRCIARHLSTLSRLVWGKAARSSSDRRAGGGGGGSAVNGAREKAPEPELPFLAQLLQSSAAEETSLAYLAELGSIGGGAGNDPLVDLLVLHPPMPPPAGGSALAGNGAAWRNANQEAREIVTRLMEARGQRLATLESSPPTAQWVVLTFTGTSLIFAFAVVSISTRPATAIASRCFFTALTGALLTVLRLLLDLAEPFDGGSYSLAKENAAGALLAPTRRRLVAALTTRLKAKEPSKLQASKTSKMLRAGEGNAKA